VISFSDPFVDEAHTYVIQHAVTLREFFLMNLVAHVLLPRGVCPCIKTPARLEDIIGVIVQVKTSVRFDDIIGVFL
jgi:hypothetical protein